MVLDRDENEFLQVKIEHRPCATWPELVMLDITEARVLTNGGFTQTADPRKYCNGRRPVGDIVVEGKRVHTNWEKLPRAYFAILGDQTFTGGRPPKFAKPLKIRPWWPDTPEDIQRFCELPTKLYHLSDEYIRDNDIRYALGGLFMLTESGETTGSLRPGFGEGVESTGLYVYFIQLMPRTVWGWDGDTFYFAVADAMLPVAPPTPWFGGWTPDGARDFFANGMPNETRGYYGPAEFVFLGDGSGESAMYGRTVRGADPEQLSCQPGADTTQSYVWGQFGP